MVMLFRMPEGHSIHRLARALTELFSGQVVEASSPQGRFAADLVDGSRILPSHAWGKHLFIPFVPATSPLRTVEIASEEASWIHIHLGLYGRFVFDGDASFRDSELLGVPHMIIGEGDEIRKADMDDGVWEPPEPRGAVRLRLATEHGVADLSGPTQCKILTGAEVQTVLNRLGPDPLRNDAGDRSEFIARVRARRTAIGALVMDQSISAGPGNIYRAESLFRIGIHPYRPGNKISTSRVSDLWDDLVALMNAGLETGTIWTVPADLAIPDPPPEDPEAKRWAVYHRTGRPCLRCGAAVKEADMQGRRLFWCGSCQR